MTSMNISLPDEMRAFIEAEMDKEGYSSASEYLRTLIREAQKRATRRELEAKLHEAILSGPASEMTREDWGDLERRVWEREQQLGPRT